MLVDDALLEEAEAVAVTTVKVNGTDKGFERVPGEVAVVRCAVDFAFYHQKSEEFFTYLKDNVTDVVCDTLGLPTMYIEQCYTFSNLNRDPNNRVVATTFIGLIDNITMVLKRQEREEIELAWFDINSIPKMGYDHDKIINKLIDYLKKRIINSNILKILFPSDFTLPELKKVYEQVLNTEIDRRNFRKKLVNLGFVIDTGDVNEGYMGRPAKLYRFSDELEERNLF